MIFFDFNKQKLQYENWTVDSCNTNLKPYTKLDTKSNKLKINYQTSNSNLLFLLSFKAYKKIEPNALVDQENGIKTIHQSTSCNKRDEMKCENAIEKSNTQYKQYSCVNKDLICNCISLNPVDDDLKNKTQSPNKNKHNFIDNCDYLIRVYDQYFASLHQQPEELCDFYRNLNTRCRNESSDLFDSLKDISLVEEDSYDYNAQEEEAEKKKQADPEFKDEPQTFDLNDMCTRVNRNNDFGWIASPNFYKKEKSYDFDLNCSYHIMVQPYQTIQLRFKYFLLNSNLVDFAQLSDSINTEGAFIELKNNPNPKQKESVLTRTLNKPYVSSSSDLSSAHTFDYDYLSIYDGPTPDSPLIARFTESFNDFNKNFNGKVFNSKSNRILIVFHSQSSKYQNRLISNKKINSKPLSQPALMGFNLTYQIKGLCIEDQVSCNSLYELNCYSPNQTCNDVWDCHNGADERGCGSCKPDQFLCRNHIFCYRLEDRCDGYNQCIDKSDELNCDKWFCNSDNGTFLCSNGRCVYEQWVCDGTNDCDDGSDEMNCPTSFTSRRVITTAVLGGTLCCLLLVMALGCACKLYTLHTVGYRNNIRLSETVQSAAAAAAAAPLLGNQVPTIAALPNQSETSSSTTQSTSLTNETRANNNNRPILNNLSNLLRRPFSSNSASCNNNNNITLTPSNISESNSSATLSHSASNTNGFQFNTTNSQPSFSPTGELPLPHHSIAPPTYNQTMGLVDEYEQRQLAFIEHVRSILSQQQQQQQQSQNGAAPTGIINLTNGTSLTLIPTVTSSSTTVHRVTSGGNSSSIRRSHSSRHHHHRHHHRSSSTNIDPNGATLGADSSSSSSHRSHRSHRHRHHLHHSSTHRHHNSNSMHQSLSANNNALQINFDANRRGLIQFQADSVSSSSSSNQQLENQTQSTSRIISQNNNNNNNNSSVLQSQQQSNLASGTSSSQQSSFKATSTSINLRDRIAKLIKDIVVNHGDNIQYMQLGDQVNGSNNAANNSNNSHQLSSTESILSNISNSQVQSQSPQQANQVSSLSSWAMSSLLNNRGSNSNSANQNSATTASNTNTDGNSNNNSNNNNNQSSSGNEDDEPLIQA